ncbi:Uncharacterized protein FWK35_00002619 [Aphis craccivora]|uniref:Uncharacterized protein n=1 Tax=Aphis craccivora TaxID=307492 RepID=A0A6G0ZMI1_APHCR|nr:Uncharacterized protein FWK35_00002619 [Aphis craccivora]
MINFQKQKKRDGKRKFLCKTSFRQNRFYYMIVTQKRINFILVLIINNSERSDECIDFTMMCVFFLCMCLCSRNTAPISNFGGGFRCKSEYPWCIMEVKSKHFPTFFKKIENNKKKITEKGEYLRKTSFRPNRFFYMVVI